MRSDYVLYGIAIIFFIVAGAFAAVYTLTDPTGITATMILLVIGIISAAVGYSTKPKEIMPTPHARPTPVTPPQEATTTQPIIEETPPPTPPPMEETKPEPEPMPEPPTPMVTASMETEQPVTTAETEKPKPTRRRRKRAQ